MGYGVFGVVEGEFWVRSRSGRAEKWSSVSPCLLAVDGPRRVFLGLPGFRIRVSEQ